MLRSEDFFTAVRFGVRTGSRRLVIHYRAGETGETTPALVGVVVPKKQISRATHRNRIKRRVRALMSARVDGIEPGARVVVGRVAAAQEPLVTPEGRAQASPAERPGAGLRTSLLHRRDGGR